jgi:hypothetical protein
MEKSQLEYVLLHVRTPCFGQYSWDLYCRKNGRELSVSVAKVCTQYYNVLLVSE